MPPKKQRARKRPKPPAVCKTCGGEKFVEADESEPTRGYRFIHGKRTLSKLCEDCRGTGKSGLIRVEE